MSLTLSTKSNNKTRGFSILEVLLTAAIIGIITAVLVFKYGSFNNVILLKSQAYEIALDIREAQQLAVSVRGASGAFREDYGLFFSIDTPERYLLFRDNGDVEVTDSNGRVVSLAYYDEGTDDQLGDPYFIDSRFEISRLCINNCSVEVEDLTVTFKRPDYDASYTAHNLSGNPISTINDAQIIIANVLDPDSTRAVSVFPTGQINVE